MGFFSKLFKSKEQKEAEEKERIENIKIDAREKAKILYDEFYSTYDFKKAWAKANSRLVEFLPLEETYECEILDYIEVDGVKHHCSLKKNYPFEDELFTSFWALCFNVNPSRLDYYFASDVINNFTGKVVLIPDLQGLNPLNPEQFIANKWAKKYLKENKNIILDGETFCNAAWCFLKMEEKRNTTGRQVWFRVYDTLTMDDFLGNSQAKDLIYTPGLFDYDASKKLVDILCVLYEHKYLLSEEGKRTSSKKYSREALEKNLGYKDIDSDDIYLKVVQDIFIDPETKTVRPFRTIFNLIGEIFIEYPFYSSDLRKYVK